MLKINLLDLINSLPNIVLTLLLFLQAADHRLPEKKVEEPPKPNAFRTAKDQLVRIKRTHYKLHLRFLHQSIALCHQIADQRKKNAAGNNVPPASYGSRPKSLGTRRGLNSPFIPPIKGAQPAEEEQKISPNELDKITGLHSIYLETLNFPHSFIFLTGLN